jgi:integrase
MVVALGTGIRRGEAFGLKWTEVDFINSTIDVVRSRDISSGEIGPTKTRQVRQIQMSDAVAKSLEISYNIGDEGYVFPDYFDPNCRLATLASLANVPGITFHDLRHTFATTCLENGMSPKWVSSTLGHAKLTTTFDLYWQNFREKVDMESIYE